MDNDKDGMRPGGGGMRIEGIDTDQIYKLKKKKNHTKILFNN